MSTAPIQDLIQSLARHPAFQTLLHQIASGEERVSLAGLTLPAKAAYLALLSQSVSRPLLILVDGNKQAETLTALVETFFDIIVHDDRPRPQLLPALDVLPFQDLSPHSELSAERAVGLWRMATGRAPVTITPIASALQRTEPGSFYRQLALSNPHQ